MYYPGIAKRHHPTQMTVLEFSALTFATSVAAGLLGSLTGLGGGIILVPVLVLLFGVDIHYAAGASLISVIATSSGAAAAYVKEGLSNIRLGIFLEMGTTIGAMLGAWLAAAIDSSIIAIVFGVILLVTAIDSVIAPPGIVRQEQDDPLATRLKLKATYQDGNEEVSYCPRNIPFGMALMTVAGALSGLLGVGGGVLKVVALDRGMRVPFKASTTTSNFMIGVTAAASTGVYLKNGYIDPGLSMPIMLGVVAGSFVGARLLKKAKSQILRHIFTTLMILLAAQMLYKGATGGL